MTIILKLKNGLEKYTRNNIIEHELQCERTLADVLGDIRFPAEKAGIVLINGKLGSKNCLLRGGETVKIFPQTIGS